MAVPVLVAPDAVLLVQQALDGIGVPVVNLIPNPRPPSFLRVRQIGGHRAAIVLHARTVAVDAWSTSVHAAGRLAEDAAAPVSAMEGQVVNGVGVYRFDLFTAPTDLPDDLTGTPRFRFTGQLFLRTLQET